MVYHFNHYQLDTEKVELSHRGNTIDAEPQVFALLQVLIENRHKVVSKDQLIDLIWQGRPLSDSVVSSRIKSTRKAIGDDGTAQKLIKTIHGRGFRFIGDISVSDSHGAGPLVSPAEPANESDKMVAYNLHPPIIVLSINGSQASNENLTFPESAVRDLVRQLSHVLQPIRLAEASYDQLISNAPDNFVSESAFTIH